MRFRHSWTYAAVLAAFALLPLKSGCGGKTACIKAKQTSGGGLACPSAAEAGAFFVSACSASPVQSVDGEPTLDGQLCCYPVTEVPDDFGPGFAVGEGDCFEDLGGFGSGGVTGAGGVGPCAACAEHLADAVPPGSAFCTSDSAALFDSLLACACDQCGPDCASTACAGISPDSTCAGCMQMSCQADFDACANN